MARFGKFVGFGCVTLVVLGLGFLPARWMYREASFQSAIGKYSRELTPGMERQAVEDQLSSDRSAWRQDFDSDIIELGDEVRFVPFCGPTRVYVTMAFQTRNRSAPYPDDVLRSVKLLRQPSGCM